MIVSPIRRSLNFSQSPKYFETRPSQPRNIENFGGDSVGCLKITKDKSSKSRGQTPDAGLIIAITATPRREGRNPRLSIIAAPRREGRNLRLGYNCPHYLVNYCPRNEKVNPTLWSVFKGHIHP